MTTSSESPLRRPCSGSSDRGSFRFVTAVAAAALLAAGCASGVSTLPAGTCTAGADAQANPLTTVLAATMTCATGATEGLTPPSYLDEKSAAQAATVSIPTYSSSTARLPAPPHVTRPAARSYAQPIAPPAAPQPSLAIVTPAQAPVAAPITHAASVTTAAAPPMPVRAPAPRSSWQRPTSTPTSFSTVPQHLRSMSALTEREGELSDRSLSLTLERQGVLRVEKALQRHAGENSDKSREELTDVLREYASVATVSHLTQHSTVAEAQSASDAVRGRIDEVTGERKAVTRLMTAVMVHEAGPTAETEADVLKAIEKYAKH